jgi:hypothetical protein
MVGGIECKRVFEAERGMNSVRERGKESVRESKRRRESVRDRESEGESLGTRWRMF